jgi:hypothetical protein
MASINNYLCRLCNGTLVFKFNLLVLKKYPVAYCECSSCESLQTDKPFWLKEAYSINLSKFDTGAAQRNINNFIKVFLVSKVLNLKNIIDVGGGDGLLCRLLRDAEFNCFSTDKYATPTYAQEFNNPSFSSPELALAFEVIEHFENPPLEFDKFFFNNPKFILLSTGIYKKQEKSWWYLNPESGQHVFFYSEKAIKYLAKRNDYEVVMLYGYFLLYKKNSIGGLKLAIIKFLMLPPALRIAKPIIFLLPMKGAWNDHVFLRKN